MNKLSHIVIGAGRSGSTQLCAYIEQHPKICSSIIKEVSFFSIEEHYRKKEKYLYFFFDCNRNQEVLSTCDTYIHFDEKAIKRIYDFNPEIKLTFILRNPIQRAYSNYYYAINNGHDSRNISFIDSLNEEKEILKKGNIIEIDNLCHFYTSLYYSQLKLILKYFKRDQLLICTFDELIHNPQNLLNRVFDFLNIESYQIQQINMQNSASRVKHKAIQQFLINRNHPLRKLLRKPLQLKILKKIIIKSKIIERIHTNNRINIKNPSMTEKEINFCKNYFKDDLIGLKNEFDIIFNDL
ncbi:MAG: sulfotransferase domain-containing protein [Bacteroidia bacterium]